jgi:putative DNA primase/helicase
MDGEAPGDRSGPEALLCEAGVTELASAPANDDPTPSVALPPGFLLRDEGLFWHPPSDDPEAIHVCGPLRVLAATHDGNGQDWGVLLEWQDQDDRIHRWAMPRSLLAGDGTELRSLLLSRGLFIGPSRKAREKLAEFLMRSKPAARVRIVQRIGWHDTPTGSVFVLPEGALGNGGANQAMLQTERFDALPPLNHAGSLADWQHEVAAHAAGNSRLMLALGAAFAAPLLGLVGAEGGGFHLRGPSSIGKSTALQVAGSVWGGGGLRGWVRSWRATDNALEAVAAAHCDLLLCLDEMGEASPETVAASAYALANGAGKSRAARDGGARRPAEWRVLFLSTGEEGIADRLAEARGGPKRARAGQEVRVLDVPADTGVFGLFETLHQHRGAAALADHLRDAVRRCHGTAGRAWLERLAADPDGTARNARERIAAFVATHVPDEASGQVRRAVERFALAAAAGEMAIRFGILPLDLGYAERGVAACFKAWLTARGGGVGAAEEAVAIAQVRAFLEQHGEARFTPIGEGEPAGAVTGRPTIDRAGFRRSGEDGETFYILPESFRQRVCAGLDARAVAHALIRAGHMQPGDGNNLAARVRLPGTKKPLRVYVVRPSIFDA